MSISGIDGAGGAIGPGAIRPSQAHEAQDVASGREHDGNARAARTGDRVEISSTARALSAADVAPASEAAPAKESSGLTAERLQSVLTRLQDGFYDSTEVQNATAQNILPDLSTLSNE